MIFDPGAITVIGSLCSFRVDPCLSVGPLFGLGVVFFLTYLWTRQTSNHIFCRLRDIQDNLHILINLRKRDDRKIAMFLVLLYIMANILC